MHAQIKQQQLQQQMQLQKAVALSRMNTTSNNNPKPQQQQGRTANVSKFLMHQSNAQCFIDDDKQKRKLFGTSVRDLRCAFPRQGTLFDASAGGSQTVAQQNPDGHVAGTAAGVQSMS